MFVNKVSKLVEMGERRAEVKVRFMDDSRRPQCDYEHSNDVLSAKTHDDVSLTVDQIKRERKGNQDFFAGERRGKSDCARGGRKRLAEGEAAQPKSCRLDVGSEMMDTMLLGSLQERERKVLARNDKQETTGKILLHET